MKFSGQARPDGGGFPGQFSSRTDRDDRFGNEEYDFTDTGVVGEVIFPDKFPGQIRLTGSGVKEATFRTWAVLG